MNYRTFCLSGISAYRRGRNRFFNLIDRPLVILLYHRVTSLTHDPQMLAVSPENFRNQLVYLKETIPVVSLYGEPEHHSRPAVAITFDDGYADNYLEALPILEELGLPATFFVTAGSLGSDAEFWWDELERLLLTDVDVPPFLVLSIQGRSYTWATATPVERETAYRELHPLLKSTQPGQRTELVAQLQSWSGQGSAGRSSHRAMSPEELKLLSESRWATIGAHGMTHSCLASLNHRQQTEEMVNSCEQLSHLIGTKIRLFSYPFGTHFDYTRMTEKICRKVGFDRAYANYPGQVHRWTDSYRIPRHLVRNWPLELFKLKFKEFWTS